MIHLVTRPHSGARSTNRARDPCQPSKHASASSIDPNRRNAYRTTSSPSAVRVGPLGWSWISPRNAASRRASSIARTTYSVRISSDCRSGRARGEHRGSSSDGSVRMICSRHPVPLLETGLLSHRQTSDSRRYAGPRVGRYSHPATPSTPTLSSRASARADCDIARCRSSKIDDVGLVKPVVCLDDPAVDVDSATLGQSFRLDSDQWRLLTTRGVGEQVRLEATNAHEVRIARPQLNVVERSELFANVL